ncbi:MAG: SpoIID/LytB domain-containing protein [Myxococcales bacterium]|nr:SpoIID/LytB domain-containing protein [Myxococcales bacterium]
MVVTTLLSHHLAYAQATFPKYQPVPAEQLFASRIRFYQGVPIVSVGLEEGVKTVALEGYSGPLRIFFEEQGIPKRVYAAAGVTVRLRAVEHKKAHRRWWVRVAVYPEAALDAVLEAKQTWRSNRWDIRAERSGTLLVLGGKVLDTRQRHLLIGGFADRVAAETLADEIFRTRNLRTVVRSSLEHRATGSITIIVGQKTITAKAADGVAIGPANGHEILRGKRRYAGHLYVLLSADGGLDVVNSIDIETLLQGLVPAEIFASAPPAALEAQAIVARGAVFSLLGARHYSVPFHLCDDTHCQVYKGAGAAQSSTNKAIRATRGQVAVRPQKDLRAPLRLVESVYSASCGGHTEGNATVWEQSASLSLQPRLDGPDGDQALIPFRKGISDSNLEQWVGGFPPTYCARASLTRAEKFRWTKHVDAPTLRRIGRSLNIGPVTGLEVLGRGRGGRITGVRVQGERGDHNVLRELPVRRLFGNLNSGAFTFEVQPAKSGGLRSIVFRGAGWGHGVGMCQMGAIGRAEAGQSSAQILRFYYSGAELVRLYP